MKIFEPLGADHHELAHPVKEEDFERLDALLDGTPRRDVWSPMSMRLVTEDAQGRLLHDSDSPWWAPNALIFKPRAVLAMAPLLKEHGELLPLESAQASLVVFNALHVVDALDEAASVVRRFSQEGDIFYIQKHVFRPEVVQGCPVFKIKSLRVSPTFVDEEFVDRWDAAGLRGLTFTQVWEG